MLRNPSAQTISVTPVLWWMQGGAPQSSRLKPVTVAPYQALDLGVPALLAAVGLQHFNGEVTLALDMQGPPHQVLLAGGSVDQSGTYVFAVRPMAILESVAKSMSYWSTGNGDDTMVTLWNPADQAQDFVFTLFFAGGHYAFPVHMEGRVTRTFNISEIVNSGIPDAQGNRIPPSVQDGSAELTGSKGESQHILVTMDAGTYNVRKATCAVHCFSCNGATEFWIDANPWSVAVTKSTQLTFTSQYNTGKQYNLTGLGAWSSSNTKIATMDAGLLDCAAPGLADASASDNTEPLYWSGCLDVVECPQDEGGDAAATGSCIPILTTTYSTLWFLGSGIAYPPSTFTGQAQATITAQYASGGSFAWSTSNDHELSFGQTTLISSTTTDTNQVTVYTSGPGENPNDVEISLDWTDPEGNVVAAAPLSFTIDWPYDLTMVDLFPIMAVGNSCTPVSGNVGFYMQYTWQWESYFRNDASGLPVNEFFSDVDLVYSGTNVLPTPVGNPGVAGMSQFNDTYCFANQAASVRPPSKPPQSPLGANSYLIWTATQTYYVGSQTLAAGMPVQQQTVDFWQDHAAISEITQ